jgi:hypothetical protein
MLADCGVHSSRASSVIPLRSPNQMRIFRVITVLGVLALAGCSDALAPSASEEAAHPLAQLLEPPAGIPVVKDRYIVEFQAHVQDVNGLAQALVTQGGGRLHSTYRWAIRGFSATLSPAAVEALRRSPHVASVGPVEIGRFGNTIQTGAVWNLDRIDQRVGRSGGYEYAYSGQGVHVYVLDSGIQPGHPEFGGRASADYDGAGGSAWDCLGHGTQVAGIIGSSTYGVAKQVRIHAIRVSGENCTNTPNIEALLNGIEWLIPNRQLPAVANMSLQWITDSRVDAAINRLIDAGVTVVTIAGNAKEGFPPEDACRYAPARVPRAITVGSISQNDVVSTFSNSGTCIDIFAPGESITTTNIYDGHTTTQGTSVAAPHVAGAAALYLQNDPSASPAAVASALTRNATPDRLTGLNGSPNRLVRTPLLIPVHRLYKQASGDHMYSLSSTDGGSTGYVLEERASFFLGRGATGFTDLYRCVIPSGSWDHFLSTDSRCEGMTQEGSIGRIATSKVQGAGTVALFRLLNPWSGDHLHTISTSERQSLISGGWRDEGVTGYVYTEW